MTLREFLLPDPGEGLVEAEIVTWRVAVGDTVAVNDIVVEIETSKSLVELPSPYAGKVSALLANEGEMAAVGSPIIAIEDASDATVPAPPDSEASDLAEVADGESSEAGQIGGAAPGGGLPCWSAMDPRPPRPNGGPARASPIRPAGRLTTSWRRRSAPTSRFLAGPVTVRR